MGRYLRKPNKRCVICGDLFPPKAAAITCSDECGLQRRRDVKRAYMRRRRKSAPAKFIENRDAEAVKLRARERWRRGQAVRRARLREADALR